MEPGSPAMQADSLPTEQWGKLKPIFVIQYQISHVIYWIMSWKWGFPGGSAVKTPPANAGDVGDPGSTPWSGRFLGEGNGYPLQYSYLENPMDRRAWRATVHGVTKSWTWLSNWVCTHVLKVKTEWLSGSRMVVRVRVIPPWSWGWLGSVPPSITTEDQTACCLLGKRSKFEVRFLLNLYHFCTIIKSKNC